MKLSRLMFAPVLIVAGGCNSSGSSEVPSPKSPAALAASVRTCDPELKRFPLIDDSTFRGVVVPKQYLEEAQSKGAGPFIDKGETFWTPDSKEILEAEWSIRLALDAAVDDPSSVLGHVQLSPEEKARFQISLARLAAKLNSYEAQYAGIVIAGQRRIYWQFLLGTNNLRYCQWVLVLDGGDSVWQIQYDVDSRTCTGFASNGEA